VLLELRVSEIVVVVEEEEEEEKVREGTARSSWYGSVNAIFWLELPHAKDEVKGQGWHLWESSVALL
jgi:hypothetical protein